MRARPDVGHEQGRALLAHLLQKLDGAARLPHHRERRIAREPRRVLYGLRARGVVLRQRVRARQRQKAAGVLVHELKQAPAHLARLLHHAPDVRLDGGVAALAQRERAGHGAQRGGERARVRRGATAPGHGTPSGELLRKAGAALVHKPLFGPLLHDMHTPMRGVPLRAPRGSGWLYGREGRG